MYGTGRQENFTIDADPPGRATYFFLGDHYRQKGYYDMLKTWDIDVDLTQPVDKFVMPALSDFVSNLYIIPATVKSNSVSKLLENYRASAKRDSDIDITPSDILNARVLELQDKYDYIIIDTQSYGHRGHRMGDRGCGLCAYPNYP